MNGPTCEYCGKPIVIAHPEERCTFAFCSAECEREYEKEQEKIEKQRQDYETR